MGEELDKHLFVVGHGDGGDLGQALESDVTEHGDAEKLEDQRLDQLGLKDVAQRDPVEKSVEQEEMQDVTKIILVQEASKEVGLKKHTHT